VLYIGISDTPAWIVSQAVMLADLRGWARFAGIQVPYNLAQRDVERDLLPMARILELATTVWSPLAGGLLTGRYGTNRQASTGSRLADVDTFRSRLTERDLAVADALNQVAAERDVTPAQVAIAWIRAQQRSGEMLIPIVGARRREQLEDNLGALDVELSAAELERLDKVSRIELGFPNDVKDLAFAYGNTFGLVDNHRPPLYSDLAAAPRVATT
jgi:aryl-alcohol dehydrogenase-like predicted oxidoreductase